MVTSGILELGTNLTAETFLAVLRRFISLRGTCSTIFSDLAKCKNCCHHNDIRTSSHPLWRMMEFIPPRAPHWGGKWESAVRCVKLHLRRVTGHSTLSFEQMRTFLAQISAVINSRPLYYTSDTENNYLSPAHFLIGRSL